MHHNNPKYVEIVDDFCYIPKSFCSIKEDLGGVNFGPLVQNFRMLDEMKSHGHNITRNGFYDP